MKVTKELNIYIGSFSRKLMIPYAIFAFAFMILYFMMHEMEAGFSFCFSGIIFLTTYFLTEKKGSQYSTHIFLVTQLIFFSFVPSFFLRTQESLLLFFPVVHSILLLHDFEKKGIIFTYITLTVILTFFLIFRSEYRSNDRELFHAIERMLLYLFILIVIGSSILFFRRIHSINERFIRMENEGIAKQSRLIHDEIEKIVILEKDLSIKAEREKIFADLHHHTGNILAELLATVSEVKEKQILDKQHMESLEDNARAMFRELKKRLEYFHDLDSITRNFADGIHIALLRRYSYMGRTLYFEADEEVEKELNKIHSGSIGPTIFPLILELLAEDEKKGVGISRWKFTLEDESIRIIFQSEFSENETDFNTSGVEKKVQGFHAYKGPGKIEVQMSIPVKHFR